MEKQPIVVDLLPTSDRSTICILFRSNDRIGGQTLVDSLRDYADDLEKKLQPSKIERVEKKLIVP